MAVAPDARTYRILVVFLVGFALPRANYAAAEDSVARRQRRLLDNLQHIRVPYLGRDLGPATNYFSPRPWRSALTRYTASLLSGRKDREAAAWFTDPKNLIVGEWEILMLLRSYHALKDVEYFRSSGAGQAVEEYLRRAWRQTRTEGTRVNWKLDGYWGSENHKIVQFSNRLLLEEFAAPAEYMETGSTRAQVRGWSQSQTSRQDNWSWISAIRTIPAVS